MASTKARRVVSKAPLDFKPPPSHTSFQPPLLPVLSLVREKTPEPTLLRSPTTSSPRFEVPDDAQVIEPPLFVRSASEEALDCAQNSVLERLRNEVISLESKGKRRKLAVRRGKSEKVLRTHSPGVCSKEGVKSPLVQARTTLPPRFGTPAVSPAESVVISGFPGCPKDSPHSPDIHSEAGDEAIVAVKPRICKKKRKLVSTVTPTVSPHKNPPTSRKKVPSPDPDSTSSPSSSPKKNPKLILSRKLTGASAKSKPAGSSLSKTGRTPRVCELCTIVGVAKHSHKFIYGQMLCFTCSEAFKVTVRNWRDSKPPIKPRAPCKVRCVIGPVDRCCPCRYQNSLDLGMLPSAVRVAVPGTRRDPNRHSSGKRSKDAPLGRRKMKKGLGTPSSPIHLSRDSSYSGAPLDRDSTRKRALDSSAVSPFKKTLRPARAIPKKPTGLVPVARLQKPKKTPGVSGRASRLGNLESGTDSATEFRAKDPDVLYMSPIKLFPPATSPRRPRTSTKRVQFVSP